MAKLIKTNGDILEVSPKNGTDFKLDELQAFVGGYIEIVNLLDVSPLSIADAILVVNEEGKLNGLPVNTVATAVYNVCMQPYEDIVVGDVLLCSSDEVK